MDAVTPAFALVEFKHMHVAMRALALVLAMARHDKPTPFDEERQQAVEAIRAGLEKPLQANAVAALRAAALAAAEWLLRKDHPQNDIELMSPLELRQKLLAAVDGVQP